MKDAAPHSQILHLPAGATRSICAKQAMQIALAQADGAACVWVTGSGLAGDYFLDNNACLPLPLAAGRHWVVQNMGADSISLQLKPVAPRAGRTALQLLADYQRECLLAMAHIARATGAFARGLLSLVAIAR